jgi:hypothetical protein
MFKVGDWPCELIICLLNVLKNDFGEVDEAVVVTTGLASTQTPPLVVSLGDTDSTLILFYSQRHYDL